MQRRSTTKRKEEIAAWLEENFINWKNWRRLPDPERINVIEKMKSAGLYSLKTANIDAIIAVGRIIDKMLNKSK